MPREDHGMGEVRIRRARESDGPRIIAVMYDDPPIDAVAVAGSIDGASRLGRLLGSMGLEAPVGRTVVAEVDGRVAGIMTTMRPGDTIDLSPAKVARILSRALTAFGPGIVPRFMRYSRARARVQPSRPPEAFDVAELDVDATMRNRGIGGTLLAHADRVAIADCFRQMSLQTRIDNPARRLYERSGYRVVQERRDAAYERLTGSPGRVLMVKDL